MAFLANIGGGIAGAALSAQKMQDAQTNQYDALQQWLKINVPDPSQQALYLQQYRQTGTLNPQIEQAMKQGPSAFQNITQNPELQSAQMQALQQLQNEGNAGGTSLQDQAAIQQQMLQSNASAKGRNDAISNQMAERGLGGSGLELQAQLQNAQNANQTQATTSLQGAADSRMRALQAIAGGGQMAGQMANQNYQQQANLAQSQNAINQFNTQNAQNVANTNTQNANQAQQYNLGLQQQIANANTGLSNQQQAYNKGLLQQQYQNQLQKTSGAANAQMGYANFLQGQGQNTANMWAGIGSGIGKGLSAYQQYNNQNQDNSNGDGGQNDNVNLETGYSSIPGTSAGGDEQDPNRMYG